MKPSIRLSVGRAPFRFTLAVPIDDIISSIASIFSAPNVAQEPPTSHKLSEKAHGYVIVHDNGEVDIQPCTEEEALRMVKKTLKQVELNNAKLYRVEGDRRILVAD